MIGIDEVGRGSWAGPLLVCAVRLNYSIKGLTDSKLLSAKKRAQLAEEIVAQADVGYGWVTPETIDKESLANALVIACRVSYEQIMKTNKELVVIDGNINFLGLNNCVTQVKADLVVPSVSAASIVAKVTRDNYMKQLDYKYPGYGFSSHVGYGTAAHSRALEQNGPIAGVHRFSFKPVMKFAAQHLG